MKKILHITALTLLAAILPAALSYAQEQKSPEQVKKEFYEAIEKQVERLTEQLDLEDWQVFYVDSILTHDYTALQEEFAKMSAAKMSNSDLFSDAQDKWMEKIYQSMKKVLNEKQWASYEKGGAARDKKARDKRAAKKNTKAVKK